MAALSLLPAAGTALASGSNSAGGQVAEVLTPPDVPRVRAVTPRSGTAGTPVVISGAGFAEGVTVRFGSTKASDVRFSSQSLLVQAPPHSAGEVAITVTMPAGRSQPTKVSRFGYVHGAGSWKRIDARIRLSHTATLLRNGKVLVAGGCLRPEVDGCHDATASSEVFDPATQKWSPTGDMAMARADHLAGLLPDGRVLVAGGCSKPESGTCPIIGVAPASSEIYDPASGRWSMTGAMTQAHFNPTMTLFPTGPPSVCGAHCGQVLVVGSGLTNGRLDPTADAEIYDPPTGVWTPTPGTQFPRGGHSATLLGNGRVLVTGGAITALGKGNSVPELYDPTTSNWKPAPPEPNPRESYSSASALADGSALLAGGTPSIGAGAALAEEEVYEPDTRPGPGQAPGPGRWRTTTPLLTNRVSHVATVLGDGRVLVTGGLASVSIGSGPLALAELYDPKTGRWTTAAPMHGTRAAAAYLAAARPGFTATLLRDGRVLVVGASGPIGAPLTRLAGADLYNPGGTGRSDSGGTWLVAVLAATAAIAAAVVLAARRRTANSTSADAARTLEGRT